MHHLQHVAAGPLNRPNRFVSAIVTLNTGNSESGNVFLGFRCCVVVGGRLWASGNG